MTKGHIPEIQIKDAWLLRENASQHLHKLWAEKGDVLADDDWMEARVAEYTKAWKPLEQKILTGMCELYGLRFKQNVISVYIAPWFNAFSDPLVIGVTNDPDYFIDVLTHELLHRLFTCNDKYDMFHDHDLRLGKEWQKLFGDEKMSLKTRIHIPVHAGLKAIFLDTLKQSYRLERDIKTCKDNAKGRDNSYVEAWEYVQEHDYKEINQKLKNSYSKLT